MEDGEAGFVEGAEEDSREGRGEEGGGEVEVFWGDEGWGSGGSAGEGREGIGERERCLTDSTCSVPDAPDFVQTCKAVLEHAVLAVEDRREFLGELGVVLAVVTEHVGGHRFGRQAEVDERGPDEGRFPARELLGLRRLRRYALVHRPGEGDLAKGLGLKECSEEKEGRDEPSPSLWP